MMRFQLLLVAAAMGLTPVAGGEVMKDKCSAEVAFPRSYNGKPDSNGTVILKRGSNGKSAWTPAFTVSLGESGHIRWWCRSTTGNMFDPGTWRIEDVYLGTKCELPNDGSAPKCRPDAQFKIGSSAWNGWTPERSRCDDRSTRIRASLDQDRRLFIQCLGK